MINMTKNDSMNAQKPYQLLIFDWDGTLIDSAARIVKCMQYAAETVGLAQPDAAEVRALIGLSKQRRTST